MKKPSIAIRERRGRVKNNLSRVIINFSINCVVCNTQVNGTVSVLNTTENGYTRASGLRVTKVSDGATSIYRACNHMHYY